MNLSVRVTSRITRRPSPEWDALRTAKMQEMIDSGKTDGAVVQTRADYTFSRFFTDVAAAQEFVDWVESTNPGYAVDTEIVEV